MVFSHHYENFTMDTIYISRFFSAVKIENFIGKILIFFSQNIGCGYMLEPPWLGISMFCIKNKKNRYTACKLQFLYI